jgi:hypothetical protein
MKRAWTGAILALASLPLAACAGTYGGVEYGPGPYAYDGYYDGYYGPIYDGYWGGDGAFYYRHGAGDRGFVRGDNAHFRHDAPQGGQNFQQMHGSFTPGRGMHMPHFNNGGGGHPGGGDRHP